MLDIKRIRTNPEEIKNALNNRGEDFDVTIIDRIVELDEERRKILVDVEALKSKRNQESAQIPKLKKAGENVDALMADMKKLSDGIKQLDEKLSKVDEEIEYIMLRIPNIPNPAVPDGETDEDNVEIRRWGDQTKFDFNPKAHWDLGTDLNILDFERAGKVAGDRKSTRLNSSHANISYAVFCLKKKKKCTKVTKHRIKYDVVKRVNIIITDKVIVHKTRHCTIAIDLSIGQLRIGHN